MGYSRVRARGVGRGCASTTRGGSDRRVESERGKPAPPTRAPPGWRSTTAPRPRIAPASPANYPPPQPSSSAYRPTTSPLAPPAPRRYDDEILRMLLGGVAQLVRVPDC